MRKRQMTKIEIGFTGTQDGISKERLYDIELIVREYKKMYEKVWLHHGACIGADTQVHGRLYTLVDAIVVHEPVIKVKQGVFPDTNDPHVYWRLPYDYLVRNRHIVQESQLLIAAPATKKPVLRSGTWATIRYARKLGREIIQV